MIENTENILEEAEMDIVYYTKEEMLEALSNLSVIKGNKLKIVSNVDVSSILFNEKKIDTINECILDFVVCRGEEIITAIHVYYGDLQNYDLFVYEKIEQAIKKRNDNIDRMYLVGISTHSLYGDMKFSESIKNIESAICEFIDKKSKSKLHLVESSMMKKENTTNKKRKSLSERLAGTKENREYLSKILKKLSVLELSEILDYSNDDAVKIKELLNSISEVPLKNFEKLRYEEFALLLSNLYNSKIDTEINVCTLIIQHLGIIFSDYSKAGLMIYISVFMIDEYLDALNLFTNTKRYHRVYEINVENIIIKKVEGCGSEDNVNNIIFNVALEMGIHEMLNRRMYAKVIYSLLIEPFCRNYTSNM